MRPISIVDLVLPVNQVVVSSITMRYTSVYLSMINCVISCVNVYNKGKMLIKGTLIKRTAVALYI